MKCYNKLMDKADLIKLIISYLRGLSGNNYQIAVGTILSAYYRFKDKTFEMPSPNGGDDKNDGWVVEDALFYQIYSPIQFSSSFASDIKNKFASDFEGLISLVYKNHKWKGKINEFIFIVNTRDTTLPKDSDRFFDGKVSELTNKYSIDNKIKVKVCNNDYIFDILYELDDVKLEYILIKLDIQGLVNYNKTSCLDIIKFIDRISTSIQESAIQNMESDYRRILPEEKIRINDLGEKRERILNIFPKLFIVDEAICYFSQSMEKVEVFELVKNKYIELYKSLSIKYCGAELYDKILDSVLDFAPVLTAYRIPAEMILVYIFDRCDIFEKDDVNDFTK